jgi:hypothetical protein
MTDLEKKWTKIAADQLVGRRIVLVRYMKETEAMEMGWGARPIVLVLDDGNLIYPAMDDEGNDGGAMFTNREEQPVLPTI